MLGILSCWGVCPIGDSVLLGVCPVGDSVLFASLSCLGVCPVGEFVQSGCLSGAVPAVVLKGSVSGDFLPLYFLMIRTHMGP